MKVVQFESEREWLDARRCKITGSRLKDVIPKKGGGLKVGYYELIAERLGGPAEEVDAREWGHQQEPVAIERFEAATGKKVKRDLCIWMREDNDNIAVSPDGVIGKGAKEAVEVKCLSSARHIEAVLTNAVPSDYWYQVIQYFAVNDKLEKLYFVLFDPRLSVKDYHMIEITRAEVAEEVEQMLTYQRDTLKAVEAIVADLTKF